MTEYTYALSNSISRTLKLSGSAKNKQFYSPYTIANTVAPISTVVDSQVPFFVRNDHQGFVKFLEKYYEYLEQNSKAVNRVKNIQKYYDIDLNEDIFAERMYKIYLKYIPKKSKVDRRLLLKHIKDFYRAKGSEKSVRFLMNILFAEFPNGIYYPKKDILRASDGKWYIKQALRIKDIQVDNAPTTSIEDIRSFRGARIVGNTSGASAFVEDVDRFYEDSILIEELVLSNIDKTFENGEIVFARFDGKEKEQHITANVFGGQLSTVVDIINAGKFYQEGIEIPIENNEDEGFGGKAIISKVTAGTLDELFIIYSGAGYQKDTSIDAFAFDNTDFGQVGLIVDVDTSGLLHPNSYNIMTSTINLVSNELLDPANVYAALNNSNTNTSIANAVSFWTYGNTGPVKIVSLAGSDSNYKDALTYNQNAAPKLLPYTNTRSYFANPFTSNLTVNTGSGVFITRINLSAWSANSNVSIKTGDYINVNSTISLVTSTSSNSNLIIIDPGISANLKQNTLVVIKPVSIQSLGILGRLAIDSGGIGYVPDDEIVFENVLGGFGTGAKAKVASVDFTGKILSTTWVEVPGQPIGGSGYNNDYLPKAKVVSQNPGATGAQIRVICTLGTGANFAAAGKDEGAIQRITITSRGSNYTYPPKLNLESFGDGTAIANISVLAGVFSYPGRWLNDDGHVSSYNFLQDRDYYQNFSYVIRSNHSVEEYRNAVMDLTHPTGMRMFGEYDLINEDLENIGFTEGKTDFSVLNYKGNKEYFKSPTKITVKYIPAGLLEGDYVYLDFITGGNNVSSKKFLIEPGSIVATNGSFVVSHDIGSSINTISIIDGGLGYFVYTNTSNLSVSSGADSSNTSNLKLHTPITNDAYSGNLTHLAANSNVSIQVGYRLLVGSDMTTITSIDGSNITFNKRLDGGMLGADIIVIQPVSTVNLSTYVTTSSNLTVNTGSGGSVSTINLFQYVSNTSNLVVNTGAGNSVTTINLYQYVSNTSNLVVNTGSGGSVSIINLYHTLVQTSNLTVNTGSGGSVTTINVSSKTRNSNVSIDVGDKINIGSQYTTTVTKVNSTANTITINPGIEGNLTGKLLVITKIVGGFVGNSNVIIQIGDKLNINNKIVTVTYVSPTSNKAEVWPGIRGGLVQNTVTVVKAVGGWAANSNVSIEIGDKLNVRNQVVTVTAITSNTIQVVPGIKGGLNQNTLIIAKTVDAFAGNSNVSIALGDRINVNNKTVIVTGVNPSSNTITVNPGIDGDLVGNTLFVVKDTPAWSANSNVAIGYGDKLNVNGVVVTVTSVAGFSSYLPNTSNLTVSTGSGNNTVDGYVNTVKLSQYVANSNVLITRGDTLTIAGRTVRINSITASVNSIIVYPPVQSNLTSSVLVVNKLITSRANGIIGVFPGIYGNLVANSFTVTKANATNTSYIVFNGVKGSGANVMYKTNSEGSIVQLTINKVGSGYNVAPIATANGVNTVPAKFSVTLLNTTGNVDVYKITT